MTRVRATAILVVIFGSMPLSAPPAGAQPESGAQSTFIDASIRSSGMGRTGVAVFWGDDPNEWANPALLGYRTGVRFDWGRTQLVPDLADDVHFTSSRITLGAMGVGVVLSGKPVSGFGESRLDYGKSVATDDLGNPVGEFTSFETVKTIGVGVSAARFAEALATLSGGRFPAISRYADVSLGHAWKSIAVSLSPAFVTLDGRSGYGETTEKDRGLLARVTPYDAIGYPGGLPGLESAFRARISASYGWSEINYDDSNISYIDESQSDPIVADKRKGFAVHTALTMPLATEERLRSGGKGWLVDLFTPVLSFGATWEETKYDGPISSSYPAIERNGLEATFANVFTLRRGHVDDPAGTVIGDTSGFGVGLRYGRVAGFRYDHAVVPQSIYLKDVDRNGFTAFVDPVELWKRLR